MILAPTQQCPRCEGEINREHFTREDCIDHEITMLHCDHCDMLIESLWSKMPGGVCELDFNVSWDKDENPVQFGRLLQKMDAARVA